MSVVSNITIINPEFRDENAQRNYPFSDTATFMAGEVEFPRNCILDVLVRAVGVPALYLTRFNGSSKIIEFSDAAGVVAGSVQFSGGDYTIYAEGSIGSIVEKNGWYGVDSEYRVPIGVVVPGELVVDDFQFTRGDMGIVPSCHLSSEPNAVEAVVVGTTRLSGPVVFRGTNGALAYSFIDKSSGDKVVKFQAVGSLPAELDSCYSLPVVATSICVEQEEGSPISFEDITLQGPFNGVARVGSTNEFIMSDLFLDNGQPADPNRYAGYIVDAGGARARILWHTYTGGDTHFEIDSSINPAGFVLVVPNVVYMGHRSIYNVLLEGVFMGIGVNGDVTLDQEYEDGKLVGSKIAFYVGQPAISTICTTVEANQGSKVWIDEAVANELAPYVGNRYEVRATMYSTIGDFCSREVKMPLPDSDPVSVVEDPCLGGEKPDSGYCTFPSKDRRCYYPLGGRMWILPARNIDGDRPLLGILSGSKTVVNTVVNRSGVSSEITETRGILTVSLRGMRINA